MKKNVSFVVDGADEFDESERKKLSMGKDA